MSQRAGLLADISWFQVAASVLAAVTSAWIASSLGVAGTLIGAALGSFVVTISSAIYARTLDKGKTLIVQTASGAVVEKDVDDDEITAAFDEVSEAEHSPVRRAEILDNPRRRLRWKTIVTTALVVLGLSLAAMGAYEVVTGDAFGTDPDNPKITRPFSGSGGSADKDPEPTPTPTQNPGSPSTSTPAPSEPAPTQEPDPEPSVTEPAPDPQPAPSATVPAPLGDTPPAPAE